MSCPEDGFIEIVEPPDGARLSAADDVDADAAGLQIEVVVHTACLAGREVQVYVDFRDSPVPGVPATLGGSALVDERGVARMVVTLEPGLSDLVPCVRECRAAGPQVTVIADPS